MSSVNPHLIIDEDDDEFDWEAAVREIDVACENANSNPSSSCLPSTYLSPPWNGSSFGGFSNFDESCKKKFGTCKQSTLDKFIGKLGRASIQPVSHRSVGVDWKDDGTVVGGEEGLSCVGIDADAAKAWIYPVNVPLRDYQLAITSKALFSNTLVALPTGLGKTLIAAVVMYNYFRWFPEGKIVFAAPSRPLVVQQIEACHNIVGIPQEWTIDMTGQINPAERSFFWKSKRVFFVTPQVLEKDTQAGTCLVRHLVCLVIDEAHRALGNYSYSVAVRELMAIPVQLRIVALTATPGSKQQVIQRIIDNLHISTLEYRNESDPDVIPYVHNRKIELIEVALGKDAIDINQLLLEVIRPYVTRLSSAGLLPNRDYHTLSPPDLLNSRDIFRRAPPPDLPQNRYGEIEAYFGALITLYHIRKLLSSHGIKPAYEMLEEKMKQGSFARVMSKNEEIRKVKLLMQRSLSHGAPSPKLSKMLEVLVDHFRKNDPQNSRVIIFSNFRGSVRDIMSTLAIIGDIVKATEFIGQSSGKSLKGQSQKVQQAVLQKFRAGGYNVIVATSIGEEGLDIMEVDLVICFDANVSPLRMIQRMGRTGRKHDGRVVVLACEGSELKAYMRKQASSRAIRKHMHNGGINSFNFHPSPRMIPHIFKPEIQFVELSIDQYVPRGKKMKDDSTLQTPVFKEKITDKEAAMITKYFNPNNAWVPSLIAFPRLQAFPSRVHKVMHSNRTDMLIDSMQNLQALSFQRDSGAFSVENEVIMGQYSGVDPVEYEDNDKEGVEYEGNGIEDQMILDNSPSAKLQEKITDSGESPLRTPRNDEEDCGENIQDQSLNGHSYLFGSDFVSVDALGKVLIMSIPSLTLNDVSHSDCTKASTARPLNYLDQSLYNLKTSGQDYGEPTMQRKVMLDQEPSVSQFSKDVALAKEKILDQIESIPKSPISANLSNIADRDEVLDLLVIKASSLQVDDSGNDGKDADLSPRLTNMIQTGVVPESPVHDHGLLNCNRIVEAIVPDISGTKLCADLLAKSPSQRESKTCLANTANQRKFSVSPSENNVQTPLLKKENIARLGRRIVVSPVSPKANTPLPNLTKSSGSNDWALTSGDKSESVQRVRKFKRLKKVGDTEKTGSRKTKEGSSLVPVTNQDKPFSGVCPNHAELVDGKKKRAGNVRTFIEEEAEVSSEAEISGDEEDEPGNSSYEDSFIDDRVNSTAASSPAEASTSRVDMMAVYRRSLLSQSPMGIESCSDATPTPDYGASTSRKNEGGGNFLFKTHSFQAPDDPGNCSADGRLSECLRMKPEKIPAMPCTTAEFPGENETKLETRKRKLSFCQAGSVPVINLDREFHSQSEAPEKTTLQQGLEDKSDVNGDMFLDDQFFATLDLDAVEAQAASLLGNKPNLSTQKHDAVPETHLQGIDLHNSPTFDLGIL